MAANGKPSPSSRRAPLIFGAIILVLVAVAAAGFALLRAASFGAPAVGGPFALLDGDGRPVTEAMFRGRYMLVYFGYTFCPDVCPTTLTQVAAAMDQLGPRADRIQPVFISVDPQRDTPAMVKGFASAFGPRMVGLTGAPEQIAQVAREYHVFYAIHRGTGKPGDYTIDHSSLLYLMGPDGRFLAPIPADATAAAMATAIGKYVS